MKLFFDFFPIFLFFILFKFAGIYIATGCFLIASVLQIVFAYARHGRIETIYGFTLLLGIIMSSATLLFHNELFIKWKPTLVYWFLATFFAIQTVIYDKNLLQKMLGEQLQLDDYIWKRLNLLWICFFVCLGILNLFVLYSFDTATWVDFKLFGLMGLTFLFIIIQSLYIHSHAKT